MIDRLAIVILPMLDACRPAAFVFADAQGVTWVEPSYRDPEPSTQRAVRRIDGDVQDKGATLEVFAGDDLVARFVPVGTKDADDADNSCTKALLDYADLLAAQGVEFQSEFEAVKARIQDSVE